MKVLSLFDGVSCARVALERLGFPVEAYYASEIETIPAAISRRNFPDIVHLGDVRNVSGKVAGRGLGLLIGGSPCQDLSIANSSRQGLKGSRSSLFYEFVRILKESKPRYFVLENVASMPAEAREEITRLLGVEPILIDAALVSAQTRRRLFWTNIKGITQPTDRGILVKDILERNVPEKYFIQRSTLERILAKKVRMTSLPQSQRIRSIDGKASALSSVHGGGGKHTGLYFIPEKELRIKEATTQGYAVVRDGEAFDISFPGLTTRRGRVGKKVKNLMTGSGNIAVFTQGRVRRLTPIECERLQGLPDLHTSQGKEGEKIFEVSDAKRYESTGNAFNADVIAHILSHIPKKDRGMLR